MTSGARTSTRRGEPCCIARVLPPRGVALRVEKNVRRRILVHFINAMIHMRADIAAQCPLSWTKHTLQPAASISPPCPDIFPHDAPVPSDELNIFDFIPGISQKSPRRPPPPLTSGHLASQVQKGRVRQHGASDYEQRGIRGVLQGPGHRPRRGVGHLHRVAPKAPSHDVSHQRLRPPSGRDPRQAQGERSGPGCRPSPYLYVTTA